VKRLLALIAVAGIAVLLGLLGWNPQAVLTIFVVLATGVLWGLK